MLSNLTCTTFPINLPALPDTTTTLEDDLLNFDDLLDIAHEYEFTRTITHLWSCEDDHSTLSETGLDDMVLATISSPAKPQESPLSPFTESESLNVHLEPSVYVQDIHLHRPTSVSASPALRATNSSTMDPVYLQKNDDQIRPESGTPTTSILRGWSPPDGSQFFDLDDESLMLPQSKSQSSKTLWIPPWLATFLPNTSRPEGNTNQSLPTVSETGDAQPQMPIATMAQPKPPPEGSASVTTNGSKKENVPAVAPSPVQPSRRAIRELARSRSVLRPHQGSTPHMAKQPRSRPAFAVGASSSATHTRPPRGGIPPHIARSVTKANILRAEKECQVIRDACSITTIGGGKKPSVLRGSTAVERENGKTGNSCGGGSMQKLSDVCENSGREGRATKRARV